MKRVPGSSIMPLVSTVCNYVSRSVVELNGYTCKPLHRYQYTMTKH